MPNSEKVSILGYHTISGHQYATVFTTIGEHNLSVLCSLAHRHSRVILLSNQFAVEPTCKFSDASPETREHFLAEYQSLQHVRHSFYRRIQAIPDVDFLDTASTCVVTQLILDPSVLIKNKTVIQVNCIVENSYHPYIEHALNSYLVKKDSRVSRSPSQNLPEAISATTETPNSEKESINVQK